MSHYENTWITITVPNLNNPDDCSLQHFLFAIGICEWNRFLLGFNQAGSEKRTHHWLPNILRVLLCLDAHFHLGY